MLWISDELHYTNVQLSKGRCSIVWNTKQTGGSEHSRTFSSLHYCGSICFATSSKTFCKNCFPNTCQHSQRTLRSFKQELKILKPCAISAVSSSVQTSFYLNPVLLCGEFRSLIRINFCNRDKSPFLSYLYNFCVQNLTKFKLNFHILFQNTDGC